MVLSLSSGAGLSSVQIPVFKSRSLAERLDRLVNFSVCQCSQMEIEDSDWRRAC